MIAIIFIMTTFFVIQRHSQDCYIWAADFEERGVARIVMWWLQGEPIHANVAD